MSTNRTTRLHILLPVDLAREIDALAGRSGRSAFFAEGSRENERKWQRALSLKKQEE